MQGPIFYYLSVGPYQIDIVKLAPSCLSCILVKHTLGIHFEHSKLFLFQEAEQARNPYFDGPHNKVAAKKGSYIPRHQWIGPNSSYWMNYPGNKCTNYRCWKVLTSCYNVAIWYEMYISRNWITFLINAFKLKTIKFDYWCYYWVFLLSSCYKSYC